MIDLEDVVSDSDISQINSFVANYIAEFSGSPSDVYRRVGMESFLSVYRFYSTRSINAG